MPQPYWLRLEAGGLEMDRREFGKTVIGAAAVGVMASAAAAETQPPATAQAEPPITGIYHDPYLRHPYALVIVEGPPGVVTISGVYMEKKHGAVGFVAEGTRQGNTITATYKHLNDPGAFGGGKITLSVSEVAPTVKLSGAITSDSGKFKAEKVNWQRIRA